jgi:hypothetical protein
LHDETKRLATKEHKVPVLALFDKDRPGFLVVVHSDDLAAVIVEFVAALDPEEQGRLDSLIRQARDRSRAKPEAS